MRSRLDPRRLVRGRLGVLGYNARVGVCIALIFVAGGVVKVLLAVIDELGRTALDPRDIALGWAAVVLGVGVSLCIPFFSVRRLHDLGRSGFWWLLMLIPVVNVVLYLFIQFCPGRSGANRFGDAPRPGAAERVIGVVALGGIIFLLIGNAWRLHTGSYLDPSRPEASASAPADGVAERERERSMAMFTGAGVDLERVRDEVTFRRLFVGRSLVFVDTPARARLQLDADGTFRGTFAFPDGRTDEAALRWSWERGRFCREGTVANAAIAPDCGIVDHVPGSGMRVRYADETTGDEFWLFSEP